MEENLIKKFEELETILTEAKKDLVKFVEKGNSAAGTRVRKAMLSAKTIEQEIRVGVQDVKNAEK